MGSVSESYERAAREWDESGRPDPEAKAWSVMTMSWWMVSPGAKHDGVSQRLIDYEARLRKVLDRTNRDWLDSRLDGHEYCRICGQSWRAENCAYCTYCTRAYPPCCGDKRGLVVLPNGNLECSACHKGEIVG